MSDLGSGRDNGLTDDLDSLAVCARGFADDPALSPTQQSLIAGIPALVDRLREAQTEAAECRRGVIAAAEECARLTQAPVPMLLYCPACAVQHIDAPQPEKGWTNPPHRSHECQFCGHVWRPADVATTGVASIDTRGRHDGEPQPHRHERGSSGVAVTDLGCASCAVIDAAVAFCASQHADGKHLFSREAYNDLVRSTNALERVRGGLCRRCTTCEDFR